MTRRLSDGRRQVWGGRVRRDWANDLNKGLLNSDVYDLTITSRIRASCTLRLFWFQISFEESFHHCFHFLQLEVHWVKKTPSQEKIERQENESEWFYNKLLGAQYLALGRVRGSKTSKHCPSLGAECCGSRVRSGQIWCIWCWAGTELWCIWWAVALRLLPWLDNTLTITTINDAHPPIPQPRNAYTHNSQDTQRSTTLKKMTPFHWQVRTQTTFIVCAFGKFFFLVFLFHFILRKN